MDSRNEIREFLATRRARITPQQAGLATYGRRRVPGLRREEVAVLAGVSTDYYAQLERGNLTGVSDSVLDAIARALQLDEAEHAHLHDLARAANTTPPARRRPAPKQQIRPVVQRILDGMAALPAIVLNGRLDLLSANRLGVALYSPVYADPPDRRTLQGSPFSTHRQRRSTRTGTTRRTPPWLCFAPKPAETPTTAGCPT